MRLSDISHSVWSEFAVIILHTGLNEPQLAVSSLDNFIKHIFQYIKALFTQMIKLQSNQDSNSLVNFDLSPESLTHRSTTFR
jgi:hypothetical protein